MSWEMVLEHIYMVVVSCSLVILIGVPLGIFAYCRPQAGRIILMVVDLIQTIPVLAVMGLLMMMFGANSTTAVISIVLYLLLPIVRNTNTGLNSVSPILKETAVWNFRWRFRLYLPEYALPL